MRFQLHSVVLYCSIVTSLAGIRSANAQVSPDEPKQALPPQPPPPHQPPPSVSHVVPDSSLKSVVDRVIAIRLQDGQETGGRLLAFDGETVTLAAMNGEIFSIARSKVSGIRLVASVAPESSAAAALPPRAAIPPAPQTRSIALHLSIAPGIAVDIDHGLFHGFANASLVFPIATDGSLLGFSFGAGVGIPILERAPSLKLDVFGHVNLMADESYNYYDSSLTPTLSTQVTFGFGIGVGLHYTLQNGFTVGFAVPILGYSVDNSNNPYGSGSGRGASGYYLSSAVAMPLGFLGYRF